MCGIVGFVDFQGIDRHEANSRIRRMADAISYRGPDEEGFYVDDTVAFGHRRLAIVDLSSGQQPMSVLDGRVQIVFNGEIYNFPGLRGELETLGHVFSTNCDTEVILHAYLAWGEDCVARLNGMFAFALWDARTRKLFLARDRVGKKPLYLVRMGSTVAFASELKALKAGGLCPRAIDPEALDCYFSLGYIPAPKTIYAGVSKVRAAHSLAITESRLIDNCYWQLTVERARERSYEDAMEELEPLLDDAVRCRLMSDVPLGAFLSGGLDSSLIVASMARLTGRPVLTNSIGFDDRRFNELPAAASIARHLGTLHNELIVRPQIAGVLEKISWHFDEPIADSSAIPTWYVCEMARRKVTVALSGDGGDEGFGGYTFRYIPHMLESRLRAALPVALRHCLFGALGSAWPASARLPRPLRLKTIFENLSVSDSEAFYRDLVWLRSDSRESLYSQAFKDTLKGFTPFETVRPFYCHNAPISPLARSQFTDIKVYMTDNVLVKVDRMSMAHSLEVRSPLLDHRILEFSARIPDEFKIKAGKGKQLLRALAARRLPAANLGLPKQGFSIPAARWLRGELRPAVEELIFGRKGSCMEVLNMPQVRSMWNAHLNGSRDNSVFIWGLMMLGLWESQHGAMPASA